MKKDILLITPPLVQVNTPYAATPVLAGFLKSHGYSVIQADLSIRVALSVFSRDTAILMRNKARKQRSDIAEFYLSYANEYINNIDNVVKFLQGKFPEGEKLFDKKKSLPEGIHFIDANMKKAKSRAHYRASLFLDDFSEIFRELLDSDFAFCKYGDHLAESAPTFDPIIQRMSKTSFVDKIIECETINLIEQHNPDYIGITIPFPGTVYGAFRIASIIKRNYPTKKVVIGGGYVNSELRDLNDVRVFNYVDFICYDEGFEPWLGILGQMPLVRTSTRDNFYRGGRSSKCSSSKYSVIVNDYEGLDLSSYISMEETTNPMHNLWSKDVWLKIQLANGCYWHKCNFCDVALDYIGTFLPCNHIQAVDAIQKMVADTGITNIHFTDEAIPPALAKKISNEIISRGLKIKWWGNIRFEKTFDLETCQLMAKAGCIAICAGLECANDRLLKLINKGINISDAISICKNMKEADIMVHAYLMYGFPSETKKELSDALMLVRDLFAQGLIQSAFWHRFALTVHSPMAAHPENFGITPIVPDNSNRFALNEIEYIDNTGVKQKNLSRALNGAVSNYMNGVGFEYNAEFWFKNLK